jgi:hypothetical protein
MHLSRRASSFVLFFAIGTGILTAGCSVGTEPDSVGGASSSTPGLAAKTATSFGGRVTMASHTNLSGEQDVFEGSQGVPDVLVRVRNGWGAVFGTDVTDSYGTFEIPTPKDPKKLEFMVRCQDLFTIELPKQWRDVKAVHVRAKLESLGSLRVMNAELFPDENGDGISDVPQTLRILALQPKDAKKGDVEKACGKESRGKK